MATNNTTSWGTKRKAKDVKLVVAPERLNNHHPANAATARINAHVAGLTSCQDRRAEP